MRVDFDNTFPRRASMTRHHGYRLLALGALIAVTAAGCGSAKPATHTAAPAGSRPRPPGPAPAPRRGPARGPGRGPGLGHARPARAGPGGRGAVARTRRVVGPERRPVGRRVVERPGRWLPGGRHERDGVRRR